MLLDANGFLNSIKNKMGALIDTRPGWLQRGLNNGMELTIARRLVRLSTQPLFILFFLLPCPEAGIYVKLMYKILFHMEFFKKRFTCINLWATDNLIRKLSGDFAVKDLGKLRYFLVIEATPSKKGLLLTQQKYVQDLLQKINLHNCKPIATPMVPGEKLSREDGTSLNESEFFQYRSTVGVLQYLTMTRSDIAFPVNKVYHFLASPTYQHWAAVKRILR